MTTASPTAIPSGVFSRLLKRGVDLAAAAGGLVACGPVLGMTAFVVRVSMGTPVLFRQSRPGLRGVPFTLYKFRTMRDARDSEGRPLPDEQRLTWIGQTIRSLSIDELPQLFNVLRGDMSLVGPRPLLMRYLSRYTPLQARRHEVRPGITGLAQVQGRNNLDWKRKFELDVWYIDHWSLWLDATILYRTIKQVALREGVSRSGHATMTEFMGESDGTALVGAPERSRHEQSGRQPSSNSFDLPQPTE